MDTRTMVSHEPGYVSSVDGSEIPRQFLFVRELIGTIGEISVGALVV